MELRVLGWKYKNIRGGLGDVTVALDSSPSRWTLIQMPNGTGKTTTMLLFRAVFAGEQLTPDEVLSLRASDSVMEGQFELRLSIDDKPYRIQLRLNFQNGTCEYWTARSELRGGGLEEGLLLPRELKRLLTRDFTRLFVFDGELAKEIRAVGKDRASNAIRTLYRLDQLEVLILQVDRLVKEQQEKSASISTATERKGVTRWRRALDAAKAKRAELSADLKTLQKKQKERDSRQRTVETLISGRIEQDHSLKQRKDVLVREKQDIERDLVERVHRAMGIVRTPAKLHGRVLQRLVALGNRLTHLKLPKTISAEFFKELAEQSHCVCGRAITQPVREAILVRADDYLAEDQILVINKMKLALRESSADENEFPEVAEQMTQLLRGLRKNRTAQDQLELERVEAGDTELEQLRAEANELSRDLEEMATSLERLTTKDAIRQRLLGATNETNLPLCEAEVKRCQEKHATATKTLQFVLQADVVKDLVSTTSDLTLQALRERLRVATNQKLERLVPSEPLRVARIGGALELESNGLTSKTGVSEGQSLSVAYAFLTSLLSEAPYKLPFIVDSPAVSLDTEVRREVGELIPELFDQMIMFVISSEREGFADAFYPRKDVRYITLWKDGGNVAHVRDGQRFFRSFHSREEAE